MKSLNQKLRGILKSAAHPQKKILIKVLASKTSLSSMGFPYISQPQFRTILASVPHLFQNGENLLRWLAAAERKLLRAAGFSGEEKKSVNRAIRVLRNIVYSAGICAPPDLWVLRHVLSAHADCGINDLWISGLSLTPEQIAVKKKLDVRRLYWDLELLYCRGYLRMRNRRYRMADNAQAREVFLRATALPKEYLSDMTAPILSVLRRSATSEEQSFTARFLNGLPSESAHKDSRSWIASYPQIELGYRLVPLLIALQATRTVRDRLLTREMKTVLRRAGLMKNTTSGWTELGRRVLERGPGPFGIIHAYTPHMAILSDRLKGKEGAAHVNRLMNIAASQAANRKTFKMANDMLDRFCADHHFEYRVYIEHALGQGEAIRQRFRKDGESGIQYFGADLEEAAIGRARELQKEGILPANTILIGGADIGIPDIVLRSIRKNGFATEGAVMFVGNGFHEIRGQSNEKIIEIFRGYCEAGILLVFTEESSLSDHDLLSTAWNTYHAGFRYVHELSGQGLRPAAGTGRSGKHSWKICASLAGYAVLQKYCSHTRTIYPFPRKGGYNPPISMTYFCVPDRLARRLGWVPSGWSHP
jgi:hypothetical protein